MIVCDTEDWQRERHAFHPVINQALTWIMATDFSALPVGKYDILPDNQLFCLVQEMATEPAPVRLAESHFRYVDIQYLLAGEESIGVARATPHHVVVRDEAQGKDIVFYQETINESMIALRPGMFAVFFPHDVHRPCCQTQGASTIRKAVIKIDISLFNESA